MERARLDGDRERNSRTSCDPGYERQRNPEDDEHNDGTGGVEALVPQKHREGAGIKKHATDQDEIPGQRPRANCSVFHTSDWMQ